MNSSINLSTYTLRLRNKGKAEDVEYFDLSALPQSIDLYKKLEQWFDKIQNQTMTDGLGSVYIIQNITKKNRTISGLIKSGTSGFTEDIVDIKSLKTTYEKKVTEAAVVPFYFSITIPLELEKGFFIVQKSGKYGIKTIMGKLIKDFIKQTFPQYFCELNPYVPAEWVSDFFRGKQIKKIKFIKEQVPDDIADVVDSGFESTEGSFEFAISAKSGKNIPLVDKVVDCFSRNLPPRGFLEFKGDLEYDNIKIETQDGNKKSKVFDWLNPGYHLFSEDITAEVSLASDGHPQFSSIDQFVDGKIEELMKDVLR